MRVVEQSVGKEGGRKIAHLDTHLGEATEDLNLVLGDQLRERNEESNLESHQSVVAHSVPVPLVSSLLLSQYARNAHEEARVSEDDALDDVDCDGDDIRSYDDNGDKLEELGLAPDAFEVAAC